MNKKIADALNEVRDAHIEEAAKPKKSRKKMVLRIAAAAAMLALVIGVALAPPTITAKAVSLPEERRTRGDNKLVRESNKSLADFYIQGSATFLTGEENSIWSPVNAFMGLAMVAELAEGESRQQILDLFGLKGMNTLRTYATNIWETCYRDGNEILTLANSLWLSKDLTYNQAAMDDLAYYYYASVYKGKMGSEKLNNAIGAWLDRNTGGLLNEYTENINLPAETVFALYSTIYLRGTWYSEFNKSNNTQDVFHGYNGDSTVTYMNKTRSAMSYYWADNFSAVSMGLKNGTTMWFILPDEGYTTTDILSGGEYMQLLSGNWENSGEYFVNLSVPKFDVSYSGDLKKGLMEMGVTDVFDVDAADFSAISDAQAYLSSVKQSVRVIIDEEGVKAATYIEIPGAMEAAPPEEEVDFVVDRPFLFAISSNSVPLFVGCVTNP